MPGIDRDKLNRIEDLKSKLFNKNYQTKIEHRDNFPHFREIEVVDSWEKNEELERNLKDKFFTKTSMFKKFFLFSIIFFILALGYATYTYFSKGNTVSNDNIDISVLSNAFTAGGEDYPLLLEIVNRNSSPLDLVDLVVEYPKGSQEDQTTGITQTDLSQDQNNEHVRLSLGTVPAGATINENLKLILFGEQGSTRQIKISLEYRVEGSNAIFVKDKAYNVSISSTPVNLSIDAPDQMSSNEDFTINVKAALNATKTVSNMLLKMDFPIGFQFESATPSPTIGNNIWDLGDLAPGIEHNISISGKMIDASPGEQKIFRAWSGSQSPTDKSLIDVVFNSLDHNLLIGKSSIEEKLFVNGVYQSEYAINTKTGIQGQIKWINNLDTKINDLQINAKIYGNAVDWKTISTADGFYDSSQNTIVWDKNSESKFTEVNPGDSGTVSFFVSPLSLFSAAGGILSSPIINVDVSITGRQDQNGGATTRLSSSESKTIKIISDVGLSNKALYYSGPFANSGAIPPKVDQKTTYTIVWSLSNTANSISKMQIISTLPPWVKYVGKFSPTSEDLSYDILTGQIVWNVGNLSKGAGITGTDRQVSFQVEFTPSFSQVGTAPVIINDVTLTGHDDFANVDVRVNKASLNTRLLNDLNFPVDGDRVVE